MRLSDVIVVLSRPEKAGNVGAVCRAMKNMGLSRLRLAAPRFRAEETAPGGAVSPLPNGAGFELSEAGLGYGGEYAVIRARAIHALDVWESAETFETLSAAVKDCPLVVGTTRRRGRHRKQVTMTPPELAAFLETRPGPAALVFGNERTGLEDDEVLLCNMASHIPANDAFPSLNLSHAVQIYAYEIFGALSRAGEAVPEGGEGGAVKGQWVPLGGEEIRKLVSEITDVLKALGFYRRPGREEQERFLRDLVSRAALTEREGRYFAGIIAKAARLGVKGEKLPHDWEEILRCLEELSNLLESP